MIEDPYDYDLTLLEPEVLKHVPEIAAAWEYENLSSLSAAERAELESICYVDPDSFFKRYPPNLFHMIEGHVLRKVIEYLETQRIQRMTEILAFIETLAASPYFAIRGLIVFSVGELLLSTHHSQLKHIYPYLGPATIEAVRKATNRLIVDTETKQLLQLEQPSKNTKPTKQNRIR